MEIPSEAEDFCYWVIPGYSGLVELCWPCLIYVLAAFFILAPLERRLCTWHSLRCKIEAQQLLMVIIKATPLEGDSLAAS